MNLITRLTCCVALAGVARSQVASPAFEVATIKRADPNAEAGQMIRDPRLVAFRQASLQNLLAQAYRIKNFQISGPGWLDSDRFDIVATVPVGATKDQLPAMIQMLLKERFKLAFHLEHKTLTAYVLLAARGATRLTAIGGEVRDVRTSKGGARRSLSGKVTMPYFAGLLSNMVDRPVVDKTELEGVYDLHLEWTTDEAADVDGSPSLVTVLKEDLGLRLESRKEPVDLYVIDHVERLPTEN